MRDLVLDQPQDQIGRRDHRAYTEQLEVLEVAGVVDARNRVLDQVLLPRHLGDQHVVLVVAGDRDHHVGAHDPGPLEDPQLGRVAVLDRVLELFLDREIAFPVRLDHGYLMPLAEQLAGKIPANLSGSGDDDVHQCSVSGVTRWSTQSGCSVL